MKRVDSGIPTQEFSQQKMIRSNSEVLVGQYIWRAGDLGKYTIAVDYNNRSFESDSCITITQENATSWKASLHARIRTIRGVLDQVRIAMPDIMQEDIKLIPEEVGVIAGIENQGSTRYATILLSNPAKPGDIVDIRISSV